MFYEAFKSLIGEVLRQGLGGEALADALAKSVDCGKIYESEDRLATDVYFSLLHCAAGGGGDTAGGMGILPGLPERRQGIQSRR